MTAATFIVALIAAGLHFYLLPDGWLLYGNMTVYVAAFIATLATASLASLLSKSRRNIAASVVLIANFAVSHYAWTTSDPVLVGALNDLATAAYFILIAQTRWELGIGFLFILMVANAVLTMMGIIPDAEHRDPVFIAFSHPDIEALLGHAANILLGIGSGDVGARTRDTFRVRPLGADYRRGAFLMLGRMAKVSPFAKGRL